LIPLGDVLVLTWNEFKVEATQVPLLQHVFLPGLPKPETPALLRQTRMSPSQQRGQPAAVVS
jgi:hypothetical protein